MNLKVDNNISLEILDDKHAPETFALINANRQYLREWLPWVDNMRTAANFESYIHKTKKEKEEGTDLCFVILLNNQIVGRIGLHDINKKNKSAAIGYWLGENFSGKGLIYKSCVAIITYGFDTLDLKSIEIRCATGNFKSKAVPERLGFKQKGILQQAEFVNDKILDLYIYSMMKDDWAKKNM